MDLMNIRRKILMNQGTRNTTVRIAESGYRWANGLNSKIADENYGLSVIYQFPKQSYTQTYVQFGLTYCFMQYSDGSVLDWWSVGEGYSTEVKRKIIATDCNQISVSVPLANIDKAYMYLEETGQILFAGKESIYYGHKNVSEVHAYEAWKSFI